jgi:hypothetical protein
MARQPAVGPTCSGPAGSGPARTGDVPHGPLTSGYPANADRGERIEDVVAQVGSLIQAGKNDGMARTASRCGATGAFSPGWTRPLARGASEGGAIDVGDLQTRVTVLLGGEKFRVGQRSRRGR